MRRRQVIRAWRKFMKERWRVIVATSPKHQVYREKAQADARHCAFHKHLNHCTHNSNHFTLDSMADRLTQLQDCLDDVTNPRHSRMRQPTNPPNSSQPKCSHPSATSKHAISSLPSQTSQTCPTRPLRTLQHPCNQMPTPTL